MSRSRGISTILTVIATMVAMALIGAAPASAALSSLSLRAVPVGSWTDGDTFGPWRVVFGGYGTVTSTKSTISLAPKSAVAPDLTHAGLVVSQQNFTTTKLTLSAKMTSTAQLRTGSAPNPWEVGWLVWDYQDNDHFTYAIAKPNGWELGKRDPAYPGGQRFLATGSNVTVPVGASATYNVTRTVKTNGTTVTVLKIQGVTVASFTDAERPYTSGAVGFYSEDAAVTLNSLTVKG